LKNRLIKDKNKVHFSVSHYCLITVPTLITWEKNCHFLLIVLKAGEQGRIVTDQKQVSRRRKVAIDDHTTSPL